MSGLSKPLGGANLGSDKIEKPKDLSIAGQGRV